MKTSAKTTSGGARSPCAPEFHGPANTIAREPRPARRAGSTITIGPAAASDAPAIAALLREAELPHEDIAPHLKYFLVARDDARVVGAIGAEVHAPEALLRSLVVAPGQRGAGLGGQLVDAIERAAEAWGVRRWWLLTTTAEAFFAAREFANVSRSSAPAAIQATGQFSGGCCCSAVCLSRARRDGR